MRVIELNIMSDSEGEDRPSFAVPKFKQNYIEFESQLKAYVAYKGSLIAFKPDLSAEYVPTGEQDLSDNETIRRKQKNFVRKNLQGIVILNTAFAKHPKQLALIRNSYTSEWPSGRTWIVMDLLRKKYLPRDGLTHFDADKVLSDIIMEPNEEPADFQDRLLDVQYRYPEDISNRQVLNQFLRGCESKYKTSILQIYRENPNVTITELTEKLQIDFRLAGALETSLLLESESETLLAQVEVPKSIRNDRNNVYDDSNKICYLCGLKGHVARNCPGADQAPDAMKCQLYHHYGHRTEYCWEDEKNASRRPERWRSILPQRKDKEEDPVLISYSLMSCLRDEFDPATFEEDDCSLCLEPLEPSTDDLMAWQQAIDQELKRCRKLKVFKTPDLEEARAVKNELYSPIILPPIHDNEEDDNETTELVTLLEDLSSDEETVSPLFQPQVQTPSERPLAPYWYLRRHRERYETSRVDTHSPTTVIQFPCLVEQGSHNNMEREMTDQGRGTNLADATSAYTLVNTNHETRPPSAFAMPSFVRDQERTQASDESDVEVVPVPALPNEKKQAIMIQ